MSQSATQTLTVKFDTTRSLQYPLNLFQLQDLGEKIEHRYPVGEQLEFSTPNSPLLNIYSPQLLPLVQIKLRIGYALSRIVATKLKEGYVHSI